MNNDTKEMINILKDIVGCVTLDYGDVVDGPCCAACGGHMGYRGLYPYVDHESDCPIFRAEKLLKKLNGEQ